MFQEMLKCNLNPKYFSSIVEIVGWFHSEDKVLEVDDTSESNDEIESDEDFDVENSLNESEESINETVSEEDDNSNDSCDELDC